MKAYRIQIWGLFAIVAVLGGLSSRVSSQLFLLTTLGCAAFGTVAFCLLAFAEEKRILHDVAKIDRDQAISISRLVASAKGWDFRQPSSVRMRFAEYPPGSGPSWEIQWDAGGMSLGRVWVDVVSGEVLGSDDTFCFR
jgi:hypothetical protein